MASDEKHTGTILTIHAGSLTVPRKFFDKGNRAPFTSVIMTSES